MKIIVLSSKINGGKTSSLKKIAYSLGKKMSIGGFFALKKNEGEKRIYSLEFVSDREIVNLLSVKNKKISVKRKAFGYALKKTVKCIDKDLIILDEFGPLELKKKGHWPLYKKLSKLYKKTVLIAIREDLVEYFLPLFKEKEILIFNKKNKNERIKDK